MKDKQRGEWIEKKPYRERLKDFFCILLNEAPKPKVSRKLIKKHAVHMSVNTYYDADDFKKGKIQPFEYPRVENALVKFSEEAGLKVEK